MSYALSLLDKSPLAKDESATDALKRTAALAQLAERLGYRRFWVAEHHNVPELASSAPEILIAYLLAHTTRIRVGSGGVMLQHYSPLQGRREFPSARLAGTRARRSGHRQGARGARCS